MREAAAQHKSEKGEDREEFRAELDSELRKELPKEWEWWVALEAKVKELKESLSDRSNRRSKTDPKEESPYGKGGRSRNVVREQCPTWGGSDTTGERLNREPSRGGYGWQGSCQGARLRGKGAQLTRKWRQSAGRNGW